MVIHAVMHDKGRSILIQNVAANIEVGTYDFDLSDAAFPYRQDGHVARTGATIGQDTMLTVAGNVTARR